FYNAIYKLVQNSNNERLDSASLLDILFEKISQDPRRKNYTNDLSDIVLIENTCKTKIAWLNYFRKCET
ncbi:1652_t:CDS:2, partial [Funneliformis geosporum]